MLRRGEVRNGRAGYEGGGGIVGIAHVAGDDQGDDNRRDGLRGGISGNCGGVDCCVRQRRRCGQYRACHKLRIGWCGEVGNGVEGEGKGAWMHRCVVFQVTAGGFSGVLLRKLRLVAFVPSSPSVFLVFAMWKEQSADSTDPNPQTELETFLPAG